MLKKPGMVRIFLISYYRSRSEASEGYVFTGICLSNSGGGWSEVTHLPSPCSGQKSSTYPPPGRVKGQAPLPRTGQRSSTTTSTVSGPAVRILLECNLLHIFHGHLTKIIAIACLFLFTKFSFSAEVSLVGQYYGLLHFLYFL